MKDLRERVSLLGLQGPLVERTERMSLTGRMMVSSFHRGTNLLSDPFWSSTLMLSAVELYFSVNEEISGLRDIPSSSYHVYVYLAFETPIGGKISTARSSSSTEFGEGTDG